MWDRSRSLYKYNIRISGVYIIKSSIDKKLDLSNTEKFAIHHTNAGYPTRPLE